MAEAGRKPDIAENLSFERIEWRATSVLFWSLLLLVAATLLGLFGNGPLSRASIGSADGSLRVEYERFGRFGAPMRLTVHVRPDAHGSASFTVGRGYLEALRVQHVTPPPITTEADNGDVRYVFRSADTEPLTVTLDVQAARRWKIAGEVRARGPAVRFWQFIYP